MFPQTFSTYRSTFQNVFLVVFFQLKAGEGRYVFMPVLPVILGKITVHVSAQCTIGRAEDSASFPVTVGMSLTVKSLI